MSNNTNTNTNTYKLKNINDLNMNKDIDILYFIINLKEYYNNILNTNDNISILPDIIISKFKSIKIKDSNIGLFCLQRIEKEILREIGEEDIDKEIIEIYNNSNNTNINNICNDIDYLYNFNIIISPFLFTNNKVCVDFISYIYKKKGIDYFSILFDAYKDKTDLLLELHLLRCRLMKNRIKDNSNIIKDSNNSNSLKDNDNNSNNTNNICKYSIDDHLNISKDILLNITKKLQKFYIENASLYLTLRYDREILKTLIGKIGERYFYTSIHNSINTLNTNDNSNILNTLYNTNILNNTIIPWYLYKYIYINTCIYYDLPYNPYTLKYYLEYITSISNNIFSNEIGYILVNIKLREYMINTLYNIILYNTNSNNTNNINIKDNTNNMFINVFRHIFIMLIKCNIIRIDEIYDNILDNINIYIILLYNTNSNICNNTLNNKLNNTNSNISIDSNDFIISSNTPSTDIIIHQQHIDYISDKIKDNKYINDILDDYEHNITYDSKYIIDILDSYYKNIIDGKISDNDLNSSNNSKIDDNKLKKQLENIHIKDNNTNTTNILDNDNFIDDINSLLITLINSRKHRYKLVSSIVNNTYIEYIDKNIRNKIFDIINITYANTISNITDNTNNATDTNIFDKGDWRYNTFIKDNVEILKNKLL